MAKIVIFLIPQERDALIELAKREFRDPRSQAAFIIRQTLERYGLLETNFSQTKSIREVQNEK